MNGSVHLRIWFSSRWWGLLPLLVAIAAVGYGGLSLLVAVVAPEWWTSGRPMSSGDRVLQLLAGLVAVGSAVWLVRRTDWRLRAGTPQLRTRADAVVIDVPPVFRRPLVIDKQDILAAVPDHGGRRGERPWDHRWRFPIRTPAGTTWLWSSSSGSRVPVVEYSYGQTPNLLLLFRRAITLEGVRPRPLSQRLTPIPAPDNRPQDGDEVTGLLMEAADVDQATHVLRPHCPVVAPQRVVQLPDASWALTDQPQGRKGEGNAAHQERPQGSSWGVAARVIIGGALVAGGLWSLWQLATG